MISRRITAFLILLASTLVAAETDEEAIYKTYTHWVEVTNQRDIKAWSSFLAKQPYFLPADSPPLSSTKSIIDYYARAFSDPAFSLDCRQEHVDVSDSGDMAWSRGRCNSTFTGPDGQKTNSKSHWFKVWIKQGDGSWRCRVNSWQSIE